jgi:hypothetical protein
VVNNEEISMKRLNMFVRLIILACFVVGMAGCGGSGGSGGESKKGSKNEVSAPPAKPDQKKANTAE